MNYIRNAEFHFLFIALAGGLWWAPVRFLEGLGFSGSWAGIVLAAGALPILIIMTLRHNNFGLSKQLLIASLCIGAALSLYSTAFTMTQVVRVMVLFYLAPFWSLLIEIAIWKRKFSVFDMIIIITMLSGVVLINGGEFSFSGTGQLGDWMALFSGLLFSIGAAIAFSRKDVPIASFTLLTVFFSIFSGLITLTLVESTYTLSLESIRSLYPVMTVLGLGSIYLAPVMWGTINASLKLPPTTLTLILSAEIVSGVATGALFANETMSMFEIAGAALLLLSIFIIIASANNEKPARS